MPEETAVAPEPEVAPEARETFVRPAQAWFGTGSDTAARTPPAVRPPNRRTPTVVTAPGVGDSPNPDAEETDTFVVRAADRTASAATREAAPPAPERAVRVEAEPGPGTHAAPV